MAGSRPEQKPQVPGTTEILSDGSVYAWDKKGKKVFLGKNMGKYPRGPHGGYIVDGVEVSPDGRLYSSDSPDSD